MKSVLRHVFFFGLLSTSITIGGSSLGRTIQCAFELHFGTVSTPFLLFNMASDFEKFVTDFENEPSVAKLDCLKKSDLLQTCKHYNIDVKSSMKKAEIRNIALEYFIDENVLPESDREKLEKKPKDTDLEIKKIEYECQLMKLKEKEIEAKMKEDEFAAQLKLKAMDLEKLKNMEKHPTHEFDVSRNIRLVPPFKDTDIDKYFLHFEKVADSLKWPPDVWTLLLQSVLSGKAQEVYSSLSLEQSQQYQEVKSAILKAYELVPEAYRQKFRNTRKEDSQTFVEFAHDKEVLFERWCTSQNVKQNYENLRQLILLEEFKRCVHPDIRSHIDEQHVKDLHKAAELADDYSLTHKGSFHKGAAQYTSSQKKRFNSGSQSFSKSVMCDEKAEQFDKNTSTKASENPDDQRKDSSKKKVVCSYCKKVGHHISECWYLEKKNSKAKPDALPAILSRENVGQSVENIMTDGAVFDKDGTMKQYKHFISEGFVFSKVKTPKHPIKILRDTGASQSLLLEGVLPLSDESNTDTSVIIQGVEGGYVNVPFILFIWIQNWCLDPLL